MAVGQRYRANKDAPFPETLRETLRRLLAAAVGVGIKGQIHGSRTVAQLPELTCIEMGSQRTGDVLKPGLPQQGIVEQALDEDDFGMRSGLRPAVQAAFRSGQKAVRRRRRRKAAAVEVVLQRKDNPTHVCVVAHAGYQTGLTQG